jgi:TRAP-type C4-dicarboxylate transport system permease small subunit
MTNHLKLFSPPSVFASNWKGVQGDVATIAGAEDLYRNILQAIMGLAGLVFFAMLIVGGFKYLTSGGDPKKAASASSTLTTAVIGVVGVILAWFILLFIKNFTGIDVTKFSVSVD